MLNCTRIENMFILLFIDVSHGSTARLLNIMMMFISRIFERWNSYVHCYKMTQNEKSNFKLVKSAANGLQSTKCACVQMCINEYNFIYH